jgi:D-glycero-D-manno-heptose 1,7-bisphosphate phosphatase
LKKVLFLDRDGVINIDHGYVYRPDDFEFMPGIFDLVRHARSKGFSAIVVTNQSGIGRGYYTEEEFASLTQWMCHRFEDEDAALDHVFHCPYHPDATLEQYRAVHPWRKPAPGMLLAAAQQFDIDLPGSVLIGDRATDMQAAQAAGVGTKLLLGPDVADGPAPAAVLRTLADAKHWLI